MKKVHKIATSQVPYDGIISLKYLLCLYVEWEVLYARRRNLASCIIQFHGWIPLFVRCAIGFGVWTAPHVRLCMRR